MAKEGRLQKKCRIVKEFTSVEFEIKKGLLNSTKLVFRKPVKLGERYSMEKCFKENKLNTIWAGRTILLIK